MILTEWFLFFLAIQIVHFLGTWKLYQRAGRKAWEALIPVYNGFVLMEIIKRPKWWIILLFIPIVNLLMFPIIWIETARSFGFNKRIYTVLTLITLGFFVYYINYATEAPYKADRSLDPRTVLGEWISSIAFAVIAATLVHTYFMQPYTIPSSSLEKTLLVGDYLFVSKFHYGARVPMTTVAAPMLHDTLPIINKKSYLYEDDMEKRDQALVNKLQLPYMRLPGFQKIKRNDIVVFSWPADTVQQFFKTPDKRIRKPIDKRSNYVKRCVGIPGDTLSIIDGYVHINGKRTVLPDRAKPQYLYTVKTNGSFSKGAIKRFNVREGGPVRQGEYRFFLTEKEAAIVEKNPIVISITKELAPAGNYNTSVFPNNIAFNWSSDNFGPIYIPEAGKTVTIDLKSLPLYKKIIAEYEHNDLVVNNEDIYINGKKVTSYTFKQDYYWMMGDNRNNSEDSRYWGYVPFDHVVGKPVMIWFSWDANADGLFSKIKSIRWNRMFTTVGGNGELVSYRYLVFGLILAYIGYSIFRSRRKKKAS